MTTPPPVRTFFDANNVDLFSGVASVSSPRLSLGDSDHTGLSYYRVSTPDGFRESLQGWVDASNGLTGGVKVTVTAGTLTDVFLAQSGGGFTPVEQHGATLTGSGSNFVYKAADGTTYTYGLAGLDSTGANYFAKLPRLQSIRHPDGSGLDYTWQDACMNVGPNQYQCQVRVRTVVSTDGYGLQYSYLTDNPPPGTTPSFGMFGVLDRIKAFNVSLDGCGPSSSTCSIPDGRPYLIVNGGYTDSLSRTTTVAYDRIRRPGSSADNVSYTYTSGKVSSVVADGVTTSYTYSDAGDLRTVTVKRGSAASRTFAFNIAQMTLKSDTDETGRTTSYQYTSSALPSVVTAPEGDTTTYGYDGNGNVTSTTRKSKDGKSSIATSATFPCSVAKACNSPETTTDALGNVTTYGYDANSGNVSRVTSPADANGVHPEVRFAYSLVGGVYRLTSASQCQTGAPGTCAGKLDEVATSISYAGTTAQVASATVGAGSGGATATTAMTYDAMGSVLTVDGPLAGTGDTTRYYYDSEEQLLGSVGPDPDGSGAMKRRAVRYTHNPDGQVGLVEVGTAADQSDGALAAMTVLMSEATSYDANGRKTQDSVKVGSSTYAVTQYSYDALGRPDCTAVRMTWSSLPASACTIQTAGAAGPDQITESKYDDAGRVTSTIRGVGSSAPSTEARSYTGNGQLSTLTDGNGNSTAYSYDGFDRLARSCFQTASSASCAASTGDYEQLGYDGNGNVTSRRLRDGTSIGYTFDALNRVTRKDLPGSEADVTYGYDLLGRLTSATQSSSVVSFAYDALGNRTSETGPTGTMKSTWDAGGRRTQLTWPDTAFYVNYDYDTLGEMTKVREKGATSGAGVLATYAYNDLGARTGITRGNGATTTYGYDAAHRLTSLVHDAAGSDTSKDLTLGFGYNPAGQISQRTSSNDLYAYTGNLNVSRGYSPNGLNQYTKVGSTTYAYDARGNLKSYGSTSFTYSAENLLLSGPGVSLSYDPLERLQQTTGSAITRFGYDGGEIAAEYDGSNTLLRRYVRGAMADEPLVWYEGSGTTDRRWLESDERGSIVARTNGSGAVTTTYAYDEYGNAGAPSTDRFQYTGQAWIPELGLYDFKARMYSPALGRFLQTDPEGYADSSNWYNYVGSDPINATDPTGLRTIRICASVPDPSPYGRGQPNNSDGHEIVVTGVRPTFHEECRDQYVPDPPSPQDPAPPKPNSPSGGSGQTPVATKPETPTHLACGVGLPHGHVCEQVPDKDLCLGAKQRLAIISGTGAVDFALVGGSGIIKQFMKGMVARLISAEAAADQLDVLMFCH